MALLSTSFALVAVLLPVRASIAADGLTTTIDLTLTTRNTPNRSDNNLAVNYTLHTAVLPDCGLRTRIAAGKSRGQGASERDDL